MKKVKRFLLLSISFGLLITSFNNCGRGFELQQDSFDSSLFASQAFCESELRSVFQKTYHPFLTTYCNACHSSAQGSLDLSTAYEAFSARGEELINYQATHAHGGNNFSSAMQVQIDKFKSTWTSGQAEYQACVAKTSSGGGLITLPKVIPNIEATADNNSWVSVQWDLEKEVESWAAGRISATFKIEARLNKVNGAIAGLLVRNPTLKLTGGSNVLASGMMIHIDNREQTAVTTYSTLYKIVSGTAEVKLMEASGAAYAAYPGFSNQSRLAFQFKELSETGLPPSSGGPPVVTDPIVVNIPDVPIPASGVTYSQLVSGASPYRVFNRSCNGCHNSGSGRLDLTNYDAASAASALITQRMNDTAAPMPPTGLLRKNDRDIVEAWIRVGNPR